MHIILLLFISSVMYYREIILNLYMRFMKYNLKFLFAKIEFVKPFEVHK